MESSRIPHLCYLFMKSKSGRDLMDELKKMLANNLSLPRNPELLNCYGGAENYLIHKDGQLSMIKYIEQQATTYRDKEIAIMRDQEKKAKKEANK